MTRLIRKLAHIDESGDPIRRVYHYQIYGTSAPSTAISLVEAALGPTILTPRGVLFRAKPDCRQTHYNHFDVDIEYLTRPQDIGTWFWELDGGGEMENLKTSLEEVAQYPASPSIPSNNIIGLDEGQIQGVDVPRPGGKLVITFTHPIGFMTMAYGAYLTGLIGCYNSGPWQQWQAGEVRFDKPRVSDGSQAVNTAVLEYSIRKNRTNFTVGPITGISKLGWHVIDVRTKPSTATSGGATFHTRIPTKVYVHRVSEPINFSTAFGI